MAQNRLEAAIGRRRFLALAGAAGGAAALAGCGGGGGNSSGGGVTYWVPPNTELSLMQGFLGQIKTGYQQKHAGAKLDSVLVPWEEALTKYTAAFSGGNPPDVTYQIIPWMNKWRTTGALADFRALDKSYTEKFVNGINPDYVKAAEGTKGELLGLPYVGGYWVLVVNEAVWEKAGKPAPPKTYDEMIPFAQAMTFDKKGRKLGESGYDARNVEHYGMTWAPSPPIQDNYLWHYFWSFGSDYISADGMDIGFNNDAGRAALQHMKAMVDSGAATPPNLYTEDERWRAAVMAGKSGMAWSEGFTQEYAQKYPKLRIKVLAPPAGPGGAYVVGACGFLSVAAKSKNKTGALDLVKYLVDEKPLQDFNKLILAKPVRPQPSDYYDGLSDPRMTRFMNEAAPLSKFVKTTRILAYQPQEYLMGKVNDYLVGRQSLDAMINEASKQIKQMAKAAK
ncbi:ABC transporter substrate-binding protein [Actinomadura viridis]|uniref:ABC transporter substrate-binding protein n=1 Tax=Actinomadura viridis TaxID=58110 RepID=UPI0036BD9594